jgi:hypothetical protein
MKIRFAVPLALALFVTLPALAQRGEEHHDVHANQGHIPQAAPPHRDVHAKPEVERHEGMTATITAFGSLAVFPLRSPYSIGLSPAIGAGIVWAITLSCTTIPTIPDGIWCTTLKPASMCTPNTRASKPNCGLSRGLFN